MGAAIRGALQQQFDALNELYDKHLAAVKRLQATLLNEILPGLVDEQGWNEQDVDRAVEWLEDTRTFRSVRQLDALKSIKLVYTDSYHIPCTESECWTRLDK